MSNTNKNTDPAKELTIKEQKEVEYYSALVNGWVNTRMEASKTKVALSAGAIGILVSLLTTVGVESFLALLIYCFAIFSFAICCIFELIVFHKNSDYLESVIKGNKNEDQLLSFLDKVSISSFIFGIVLAFIIGLSAGWNKYNESLKEQAMTKKNLTINTQNPVDLTEKSLNGIAKLSPDNSSSSSSDNSTQTNTQNQNPTANTTASDSSAQSTNSNNE